MNIETELLKIHVYVGYCHSTFRVRTSYILGAAVALVVSLMSLCYQRAITVEQFTIAGCLCALIFGITLWFSYRSYRRELAKVDNMIECVDKGDSLPSTKDMIEGKGI